MSAAPGSSSNSPFRINLQAGLSYQEFAGVTGASFSQIKTYYFGGGLFYTRGWWSNGLSTQIIPPVTINPFRLSDNTRGSYTLGFQRYALESGIARARWRFYLLYGFETASWAGTPDLGYKSHMDSYYGVHLSFDAYRMGSGKAKLGIPIDLYILSHPARKYEFANYASDTVNVNGGLEIELGTGVAIDF